MADEVHLFPITVPASTAKTAPLTFNLQMPLGRAVERIEVQVPPGPRGEVGWQIAQGGNQLYPYETGAYVIVDAQEIDWDVVGGVDSGAWQVIIYNTGSFPHTLGFRFLTHLTTGVQPAEQFTPLPLDALQSA